MFVPINLLKDLVRAGRRRGAARPWLGLNTEQIDGQVVVTRVLPESPADQSGLRCGDVVIGLGRDTIRGQSQFYERLWASGVAGGIVMLHIVRDRAVKQVIMQTCDRLTYLKPWRIG